MEGQVHCIVGNRNTLKSKISNVKSDLSNLIFATLSDAVNWMIFSDKQNTTFIK